MREYFAYIRVSTVRQGEHGASLPQQKTVISEYAKREGLHISRWFEERETAAKVGRTEFRIMLNLLSKGKAHGLLIHKIDRGARNLKDWAALSELSDSGIDVRIAGDSIDLTSRGGRLSADIQAVVAADYIRNLREEVKKGQRGRLGQGLYPFYAPLGYLNSGNGAEPKPIDPIMGPLVRRAFEEYASGKHTLHSLSGAMETWGVVTRGGKKIGANSLNELLRRRFYIGIIEIKGETYIGVHEPLVSKFLFDQVQKVLDGRSSERVFGMSPYSLRRMLLCVICRRHLYAETQKGHAYYRCHSKSCRGTSLRESLVLRQMSEYVHELRLSDESIAEVHHLFAEKRQTILTGAENFIRASALKRDQVRARLTSVTDAYLDQQIDKNEHAKRRSLLLDEDVRLTHSLKESAIPGQFVERVVKKTLELGKNLQALEKGANAPESVELIKSAFSNFLVSKKTVEFEWRYPLQTAILREAVRSCGATREGHRTLIRKKINALIDQLLVEYLADVRKSESPGQEKRTSR